MKTCPRESTTGSEDGAGGGVEHDRDVRHACYGPRVMAHVLDIAKYMLEKQGRMTTMKLQHLAFYAHVHAVVAGEMLFSDPVKAWAAGPVVPALFHAHQGRIQIGAEAIEGDAGRLTPSDRGHIDATLAAYGSLPAAYLGKLTHHERPWQDANERGDQLGFESPVISDASILAFYADKSVENLQADYQMTVARVILDEHRESLARLTP